MGKIDFVYLIDKQFMMAGMDEFVLPEKMENTDMDNAIMKDVDKWWHGLINSFWTERNTKRFNRTFKTTGERDTFLLSFIFEKMNRLEKQDTFTEVDALKQDVKELCKDLIQMEEEKQEITQITFTEIDALKHEIELMKSQLTKLSDENKQLRLMLPVKIDDLIEFDRATP